MATKRDGSTTYEAIRDRIAEALRPKFKAGKLRGWTDADSEMCDREEKCNPPLWKLEQECARLVRDEAEAFTVLLHSPFAAQGWAEYESAHALRMRHYRGGRRATYAEIMSVEARGKAGLALSRDILIIARERGWYWPASDEWPSATDLRLRRAA